MVFYNQIPTRADLDRLMSADCVRARYSFEAITRNRGYTGREIVNKNTRLKIINCYIDHKPNPVGPGRLSTFRLEAKLPDGNIVHCMIKEMAEISRGAYRQVHLCNLFEIVEHASKTKGQLRFRFKR